MVKSGLRICGCADVDIDKLELNFIFRLRVSVRVRVGVRVRVSVSIYLIDVIKLRIASVLTNNIRKSAVRFLLEENTVQQQAHCQPPQISGFSPW